MKALWTNQHVDGIGRDLCGMFCQAAAARIAWGMIEGASAWPWAEFAKRSGAMVFWDTTEHRETEPSSLCLFPDNSALFQPNADCEVIPDFAVWWDENAEQCPEGSCFRLCAEAESMVE